MLLINFKIYIHYLDSSTSNQKNLFGEIKRNMFKSVTNEKNLCEISDRVTKLNIKNIRESASVDKFIEFEDAVLAEVIVDHLIRDLNELKESVANLKSGHGLLVNKVYPHIYEQKKELISKCILNCQDEPDSQKLVH